MNIDTVLLSVCERVTHWLQIHHDRDNFWVANALFNVIAVVPFLIYAITAIFVAGSMFELVFLLFAFASAALLGRHWIAPIHHTKVTNLKRQAYYAITQGCRNPIEANVQFRRAYWALFFFCMGFSLLAPLVLIAVMVLGTLLLLEGYFLSVTPLHPNELARRPVLDGTEAA